MMASKAQINASKRYDEKNTIMKSIKFNLHNDDDIIERIQKVDNFQKYVKELIRKDIRENP